MVFCSNLSADSISSNFVSQFNKKTLSIEGPAERLFTCTLPVQLLGKIAAGRRSAQLPKQRVAAFFLSKINSLERPHQSAERSR